MKDYITLGGRKVRVECNWNAVIAFLAAKGTDTLAGLSEFGKLNPSDIAPLFAACVNEGERLDGRDSALTATEVGEAATLSEITDFIGVYARQANPKVTEPESEKKKGRPKD